jgi:hypothetical protein
MADSGVYSVDFTPRSRLTRSIGQQLLVALAGSPGKDAFQVVPPLAIALQDAVHPPPLASAATQKGRIVNLAASVRTHMEPSLVDIEQRAVKRLPIQHGVITACISSVAFEGEVTQTYDLVSQQNHSAQRLAADLKGQQARVQLHDVVIIASDGGTVSTNGWLLKEASEHFRTQLLNPAFEEAASGCMHVGCSTEQLKHVVSFLGSGTLSGTLSSQPQALLGVLQAASSMSLNMLAARCEARLVEFLDKDNCLGLLQAAVDHNCFGLQNAAASVVLKHFWSLRNSEDWLLLPGDLAASLELEFQNTQHIHSLDRLNSNLAKRGAV